jgi:hypothetical protein
VFAFMLKLNALSSVMPALAAGIHVFFVTGALQTKRGWHRNSGLPEFRILKRCKSGKPDLQ